MLNLAAVGTLVSMGGKVFMAVAGRRCTREIAGYMAFQVLADVNGVQVPADDGREFGIYLC